jgi:hypothetical protein
VSKQSIAKENQGYEPKPAPAVCMNCRGYRSEMVVNSYGYTQEKNMHCSLGGFVVKKTATCSKFNRKAPAAK